MKDKVVGDKAHGNDFKNTSHSSYHRERKKVESQSGVLFTIITLKHVSTTTTPFYFINPQ